MILDDAGAIRKLDKQNVLRALEELPEACRIAIRNANALEIDYQKPERVIITGMGGSAIGGDLVRDWLKKDVLIPIEVYRGYELPVYANEKTLVIVVSYSGNTVETVSAFNDALKRKCMVVVITSGGELQELAKENEIPIVNLPAGFLPRFALPYLFLSQAVILEKVGLVGKGGEIDEAITLLEEMQKEIGVGTPLKNNLAKQLAERLVGKIPIVYGFGPFKGAAKRIRTEFHENAKVPAFWGFFPELSHNEILGWESDLSKNFFVIMIRDKKGETEEYIRRIDFTEGAIKKKADLFELEARGKSKIAKILSLTYVGGYASVYLALLNGVNPAETGLIDEMKEVLKNG